MSSDRFRPTLASGSNVPIDVYRIERASTAALRAHLAAVESHGEAEAAMQRSENEVLVFSVLQLRARRREMRTHPVPHSAEEVKPPQDETAEWRAECQALATWDVWVDPDDRRLAEARVEEAKGNCEEWTSALGAVNELLHRLNDRRHALELQAGRLRSSLVRSPPRSLLEATTSEELSLQAKARVLLAEVAVEALSETTDTRLPLDELPMLRAMEQERQRLHHELVHARWERERIGQKFSRVKDGLAEQRALQEEEMAKLRTLIGEGLAEEEQLVSELRLGEERHAAMGRWRHTNEESVQRLNHQIAHLSDRRDALRGRQQPVDLTLNLDGCRDAERRDRAEAVTVGAEIHELEATLAAVSVRTAEARWR